MIPQITEHFGAAASYATLNNATVTLAEMGDRIIQTQVRIDGDIVPNFDDWWLAFRGEHFVLDVKDPQAVKDNSSRNSVIDLTFYSWATVQLKRYFFFTAPSTATGIITVDKYEAPIKLTLENFGVYLNQVLDYYFHGKITAQVYVAQTDPENAEASWDINYTKIWDVLQKIYELYGVRWRIEYDEDYDSYVIKINYPAPAIEDHDFEYGFEGGLLRFERQVQNGDITNILLGRGGTKNVPYRYFKRVDPQNPEWAPDPDAIPELANLYIDRIRDINFRNYVQGWKTNPNRDTTTWPDTVVEDYDEVRGATDWAYAKGHTDTSFDPNVSAFDPVEYVKDDESILKYGEKWGHLDDDDDIYPTIQGCPVNGGPADLVVAVSPITSDDIYGSTSAEANIVDLSNGVVNQTNDIEKTASDNELQYEEIHGDTFTVPTGMTASLVYNDFFITADVAAAKLALLTVVDSESRVAVFNASTNVEISPKNLTAGTYYYVIYVAIRNANQSFVNNATYGVNGLRLEQTPTGGTDSWKPTFDIWIRNIFDSAKSASETEQEYSLRVWGPVLGDHLGQEATVAFSDGQMSISEDYNFKIASYPERDDSKTITVSGVTYKSEWKITLYKTDAEFDATGYYVPNSTTGGKPIAGDHFYFTGIDMPHYYVVEAEKRVNNNKVLALYNTSDIAPTWVIGLDKIRIDEEYNDDQERLFDKIEPGVKVRVVDKRFTKGVPLVLYANSVTFTWADDTVILPQVDVVLVDKIAVTKSQIAALQGDVSNLKSSVAQMANSEMSVKEAMKPLFLGKTGEEETSLSPTKFASLLTSEDFKQGGFGGKGWGFYRDNSMAYQDLDQTPSQQRLLRSVGAALRTADGETQATPSRRAGSQSTLEIDRLIVRREMHVNNLVVNQIAYVGGKQIISAAAMECTQVVENDDSYDCYFDQKQGTIKNLFQVGDIAMGQVFTPANVQLRFYKMVVTKVGLDHIRLGKSPKNGSGVPEKGDVIVQYGNVINRDRRYAIIRDVIGGGYEQMLSDLDTVYANGVEYYFAGLNANVNGDRQDLADSQDKLLADSADKVLTVLAGAKPRFFVGNADSNIEFNAADGIFRLKGNIVQSPSGVEFPVPCFRREYSSTEWYYYGDLVTYTDGSSWIHIGKERTKGTAPSTGNVWRLYTASGKSNYRLDLSNDNASINADSSGNILPGAVRPDCTATLYYGTDAIPGAVYSLDAPSSQNVQGVSINSSTGVLTFNAGNHTTPFNFSGNSVQLTITATVTVGSQTVTSEARMTINKNVPGAQGEPATSYWLVLSADKVKVNPNESNPTPNPSTITAEAWLQVGEDTPRQAVAADGLTIKYKYDNGTYADYPSGGITVDKTKTTLYLILYKGASIVDGAEAIPILWDGVNGSSAAHLDLDNEMDMVQTDSTGKLMSARTITTHATMYDGETVATGAQQVSTAASLAIGGVTPTVSMSSGVLTVSWAFTTNHTLSAAATVNIQVSLNGTTHTVQFTIAPSLGQAIYQLKPSISAVSIHRNSDNTLTPASVDVGLSVVKIDGPSTTEYGTFPVSGVTVIYSTASMPSSSTPDTTHPLWPDQSPYKVSVPNSVDALYIAMFDSNNVLIDRETVPVVKDGAKGGKGDDGEHGKTMRGPSEFSSSGYAGDSNTPYQGLEDPYDATHTYYDVVTRPGTQAGSTRLFYCQHESKLVSGVVKYANEIVPEQDSGTVSDRCWIEASVFEFVATKVFLADNAKIKFLSGNDIYVTGNSGNNEVIYAGMLGGTGINFFAGLGSGNTFADQVANAAFRVDNEGNMYASKATIDGKLIARGNAGQGHGSALVSMNGLFVSSGDSYFSGDIIGITDTAIHAYKDSSSAEQYLTAKNGSNIETGFHAGASGVITYLIAKDASHYAKLSLYGTTGDVIVQRGSSSSAAEEYVLSSPTLKHIIQISESDYNSLPSADKNDSTKEYHVV